MKRNYKYLLSLTTGIVVITGNLLGGYWVALNLIFTFGVLATLEGFVWENKNNQTDEDDIFPEAILFFHVMMQSLCIASLMYAAKKYEFNFWQLVLASVSTGINTGSSGLVIAHELIHRKGKIFHAAGKFLLLTACNIYFYVDHLKVHHKWVGTTKDAATSRYGESLYYFFIRTTLQQIHNAWHHEKLRLKNEKAFEYGFRNYVISMMLVLIVAFASIYFLLGWKVLFVFLFQSLIANFLLEYTNYIEHYGLTRNENERVSEVHSWQSDKIISRYFLIDLSRHADHHYYASKPYHTLKSYETAPILPLGYAGMIYYALIPPLWFKTMHPILKAKNP